MYCRAANCDMITAGNFPPRPMRSRTGPASSSSKRRRISHRIGEFVIRDARRAIVGQAMIILEELRVLRLRDHALAHPETIDLHFVLRAFSSGLRPFSGLRAPHHEFVHGNREPSLKLMSVPGELVDVGFSLG